MPDEPPNYLIPTPLGRCESCGEEITGAGVVVYEGGKRYAYHDECRRTQS